MVFKIWTRNGFIVFSQPEREVLRNSVEVNGANKTVHFINGFNLTIANQNSDYHSKIVSGICYCDSRILSLYSKLVGRPILQIRGADFMRETLIKSTKDPQSVIGSQSYSSEELNEILSDNLNVELSITNFEAPFTSDLEILRQTSLAFLTAHSPKIVWVAIGTPKQDFLAYALSRAYAADYYCVGAAVSFLIGEVNECPKWLSLIGLEWFYRLTQEPQRLWRRYLFGNFRFIMILIVDLFNRMIHRAEYLSS